MNQNHLLWTWNKKKWKCNIGNVRTVKVTINGDGKKVPVPLTTKNKAILKANDITIPDVQEEPTTGDGSIMEQVASETDTQKITPQDAGLEADSNFFTSLESVKAILPNDMSGKEIKENIMLIFLLTIIQYTNQQYNNTSWQKIH